MGSIRQFGNMLRAPSGGAISALFPELASDRRDPASCGIAAWAGARGTARLRAQAEAVGAPFVLLAQGLLRAPPRGRASPPCLSALALEISRPGLPAGIVSPGSVLADRGWESPALLAQAAAGRRALASARIGGDWWHSGGEGTLPAGEGYAIVVLAEPALADSAGLDAGADKAILAAMLDTALAENPANRVVILAPGPIGDALQPRLAAAAARGAAIIGRDLDPWLLFDRAARVYSGGGEIGFLALIAEVPVVAFGRAFYTGWGATEDAPGGAAACVSAHCRRDFRRRLPHRDALSRPVPQHQGEFR